MNEELKRRAEYVARHTLDEAASRTIDDLLAECERLTGANALFRARIDELEQRAPESCCCNPSRCTRACTPRGEWIERQRAEQPKPTVTLAAPHVVGLKCAKCGKPAYCSALADSFGKSDKLIALCNEHAPKPFPAEQPKPEPLCEDEGCDHAGVPHVCVSPKPEPVAWLNYPVITKLGEFFGYGKPELSFSRGSYGYDWGKAQALYTAPPAPSIPPGYALVPIEPTEAMVEAGWIDKEDVNPDDIWSAMLAAAKVQQP